MHIDSVRELKAKIVENLVQPFAATALAKAQLALPARSLDPRKGEPRIFAIGVAPQGRDYKLAIRVQRRGLMGSPELERIARMAKGEVQVRYIGRVFKHAPWYQKADRPLLIGSSIGHFRITAGTLGCYVRPKVGGGLMVLSNNHVLADENRGKKGDVVIQPGDYDGGRNPQDRVGTLASFVRLSKTKANLVDCATASIADGVGYNATTLKGIGKLSGLGPAVVKVGARVHKVGRTTGVTHGKVTAFELDNVIVQYDLGNLRFDDQIEIEGTAAGFSDGGDSGSLIVDDDFAGVALLFAGSDQGGSNGRGLTFANPLHTVLRKLKVDLVLA